MNSRRLLLLGAILSISTIFAFKWVAIPYIQTYLLHLLAQNNIQLVVNDTHPSIHVTPFSIGVEGVEFEIRDTTQDMPYAFTVYVERLEYRLLRPSSSTRQISSPQSTTEMVQFAHISCSNTTIVVHEPHPQPRLEVLDTQVTLLAPTIREAFLNLKSHILLKRGVEKEDEYKPLGLLVQLEVMTMRLTTHTVTSVPISVNHPAVAWLIEHYPSIFGRSVSADGSLSNDSAKHLTIYPPHLSLLTPSIVLPAAYQALSAFRQRIRQDDNHHHYKIPISLPLSPIEVKLQQKGRSQIKDVQVRLLPSGDADPVGQQTYQCSDIGVAHVRQVDVTGRDANGEGGCCALHVGHVSNLEAKVTPVHASSFPSLLSTLLDIASHPVYLAAFIHSVHSSLASNDICTIKDLLAYHIHEVKWIDMTPLPSSPVARVMTHMNRGLLNLFEPVIGMIL